MSYEVTKRGSYAKPGTLDTDLKPFVDDYLMIFATPPPWIAFTKEMSKLRTTELPTAPKWSGGINGKPRDLVEPPPQGTIVKVCMNGIGRARVLGYFVECGFLGMLVMPEKFPAWYLKQNGRTACHVYGNECEAIADAVQVQP